MSLVVHPPSHREIEFLEWRSGGDTEEAMKRAYTFEQSSTSYSKYSRAQIMYNTPGQLHVLRTILRGLPGLDFLYLRIHSTCIEEVFQSEAIKTALVKINAHKICLSEAWCREPISIASLGFLHLMKFLDELQIFIPVGSAHQLLKTLADPSRSRFPQHFNLALAFGDVDPSQFDEIEQAVSSFLTQKRGWLAVYFHTDCDVMPLYAKIYRRIHERAVAHGRLSQYHDNHEYSKLELGTVRSGVRFPDYDYDSVDEGVMIASNFNGASNFWVTYMERTELRSVFDYYDQTVLPLCKEVKKRIEGFVLGEEDTWDWSKSDYLPGIVGVFG